MIEACLILSLEFRPPIPFGWLVAVGVVWLFLSFRGIGNALRLGIVSLGVGALLLALRVAGVACLLWALAGPSVTEPAATDPGRPRLEILMDVSASMSQPDAQANEDAAQVTRLEAVKQAVFKPKVISPLEEVADVDIFIFDSDARPLRRSDLEHLVPAGDRTAMYASLQQRLAHSQADSFLLIGDGHDTTSQSMEQVEAVLAAADVRLQVMPVGLKKQGPDLSVQAWAASDYVFAGQSTDIEAVVQWRGFDGGRAVARLYHQDQLIDQQAFVLDASESKRLRFEVYPEAEPGRPMTPQAYRVQVESPRKGAVEENDTDNNRALAFVQVSRERIRVLMLEGQPYWDTRVLAHTLNQNQQVQLTAIYRLSPQRLSVVGGKVNDRTREVLPLSAEVLSEFDVVILGRRIDSLLDAQGAEALADFVIEGGALVLARGRPFEDNETGGALEAPLARLMPVRWGEEQTTNLRIKLAEAGGGDPLIGGQHVGSDAGEHWVTQMPGMIAATRVVKRQAASVVVLEQEPSDNQGPSMAALVTLRVGQGAVMAVLSDGLWQWDLIPVDGLEDRSVYAGLWSRAIQWLATGGQFLPSQDVALQVERLSAQPGERIPVRVSLRYAQPENFEPVLEIIDEAGSIRRLRLSPAAGTAGTWGSEIPASEAGVYRVRVRDDSNGGPFSEDELPEASFVVVDRSLERRDPSARPDVLERLAEAGGGECLSLGDLAPVLNHLQSLQAAEQRDLTSVYDWARPGVLAAILLCLGTEWVLRRRNGML